MSFYKNTTSGAKNVIKNDIGHLQSMYKLKYFAMCDSNEVGYMYLKDTGVCPDPILYWTNLEEIFNHLLETHNVFHIKSYHIEKGDGRLYINFSGWLGYRWFIDAVIGGESNGVL